MLGLKWLEPPDQHIATQLVVLRPDVLGGHATQIRIAFAEAPRLNIDGLRIGHDFLSLFSLADDDSHIRALQAYQRGPEVQALAINSRDLLERRLRIAIAGAFEQVARAAVVGERARELVAERPAGELVQPHLRFARIAIPIFAVEGLDPLGVRYTEAERQLAIAHHVAVIIRRASAGRAIFQKRIGIEREHVRPGR
jgi:hypothetical protein